MSVSRQLAISSAFTLATLGAAHAGQIINANGPGLRIEVDRNGTFQVYRGPSAQLAGEGIVASVDARLEPFMTETQSVSGDGSPESPYRVETLLVGQRINLWLSLTYVAGDTDVVVTADVEAFDHRVQLYHLIDSQSNYESMAFWSGAPASPERIGLQTDATSVALVAATAFDYFHAGEGGLPSLQAYNGKHLDNTLDAAQDHDRSLGAEWTEPAMGGWRTIKYRLEFGGAVCGDGLVAGAEMCDDGNWVSGDQCTASCMIPRQGDLDDDQVEDTVDLCPGVSDSQSDVDADGIGDACDPTDDRRPGLGGSGLPPPDDTDDDDWGSDDVGPPPAGPNGVPLADDDATITNDGDEAAYGTVTDDEAGCSAGGGGAGGGMLLMLGLAAMLRRRKP